jgi:hypothetical protein
MQHLGKYAILPSVRILMEYRVMSDWPTGFLFADQGFISGAASVLDLAGVFSEYNGSREEAEADVKALLNDWYNVGQDLAKAMPPHAEEK